MDKFTEMKVFVQVVEAQGFSGAARAASLTPSAVSKLIARLEDRLGVLLFVRSSRNVKLTGEGEIFLTQCRRVLRALDEAEAAVAATGAAASGLLRVYVLPAFAQHQLAPLMPGFLRKHPTLRVEFQLGNAPLRLLDSGIDVAIQSGSMPDSTLIVRRITSSAWRLCASPDYLAARGAPTTPADLIHHDCLNFALEQEWNAWSFHDSDGRMTTFTPEARLSANHGEMLMELARAGAGIARLTEFQVGEEIRSGRLAPVLDEFMDPAESAIYAVYHSRRHLSPRVSAFLDFLLENFGHSPPWKSALSG